MKRIIIFIFFLTSIDTGWCQIQWQWALAPDSANHSLSVIQGMASDNAGNILITGSYIYSLSIGGSTIQNAGNFDFFTASIKTNGTLNWINHAGGSSDENGAKICVDNDGNAYVTGVFTDTLIVGSSVLTNTTSGSGHFLIKYSSAGNVLWAKKISQGMGAGPASIKNKDGLLYLFGSFSNTIPFVTGSYTFTASASSSDLYVVKLDTSGNVLLATQYGGTRQESAFGLSITNAGEVILSGTFTSTLLTFGGFTLNSSSNSNSKNSVFLVKMNSSGNVLWAKAIDQVGGYAQVSSDQSGNICLAGYFVGPSLVVDNFTLTASASYTNGMIIKFDNSGNALWANGIGGTGNQGGEKCSDVAFNAVGDIFISGIYYSASLTIGTYTLANNGVNPQLFIVQLNQAGNVTNILSGGGQNADMRGSNILADQNGNIRIAGIFAGDQISFGPITTYGVPNKIFTRMFVAQANVTITGLTNVSNSRLLKIYPNPANYEVMFTSEDLLITNIRVFDITSKEISELNCSSGAVHFPVADLQNGIYIVEITTSDNRKTVTKIVKTE
jgi:hypothetical protein